MKESTVDYTFHPYRVILFFTLLAISSMFSLLIIAYLVSSIQNNFPDLKFPWLFHLSTMIILLCSFYVHRAHKSMQSGAEIEYEKGIRTTLIFGSIFMLFQGLGWYQMFASGIEFKNSLSGSYIYAISGLHVLHVLAGIIPLSITFYRIKRRQKDPVKSVVFEANPLRLLKIKLLATYWHFIDVLWILLYVFFLVVVFLV